MISMQVWRIPHEKISVNTLSERPEEAVGVYAKDDCLIPWGMGKYIPVQTNLKIKGEVLIEISDKTILRLLLPEIVYNIKKKLGFIYIENHNSETRVLKRGHTIGIVMQEEEGHTLAERSDATQSVTWTPE